MKTGILERMWDFIQMWLLLRALYEQEDRQTEQEYLSSIGYQLNRRLFIDQYDFTVAMSNLNLIVFLLPLFIRRAFYEEDPITRGGTTENKRRLRYIYHLLDEAKDYLGTPNPESNPEADKDEIKGRIRLLTKEDKKATFITSYIGGLNALLTTNPTAWSFLAIALAPQWLPWLGSLICKYIPMLKFCS